MKTIYTVYQLNEKVNKFGNPYIGFTENLIKRAKAWKNKLKLDYTPELIPLYTDTSAQRAFNWEQDKRVENGWRRERPLSHLRKISKKAHIAASKSKKVKENGKKLGDIYGKILGKLARESGQIKEAQKFSAKARAVLTEEQATQIRVDYEQMQKRSMCALSKKYNVNRSTIYRVINGTNGKQFTNFKGQITTSTS